MKSMLLSFSMNYCFFFFVFIDRAVKKLLSNRLIMKSRAALEPAPKAQVFKGQGIYGHFEI